MQLKHVELTWNTTAASYTLQILLDASFAPAHIFLYVNATFSNASLLRMCFVFVLLFCLRIFQVQRCRCCCRMCRTSIGASKSGVKWVLRWESRLSYFIWFSKNLFLNSLSFSFGNMKITSERPSLSFIDEACNARQHLRNTRALSMVVHLWFFFFVFLLIQINTWFCFVHFVSGHRLRCI